jgi:hypothetical protein
MARVGGLVLIMSSFRSRVWGLPVVARRPLVPGRKEFISRNVGLTDCFGVDAVLPADVDGAPRAISQNIKDSASAYAATKL